MTESSVTLQPVKRQGSTMAYAVRIPTLYPRYSIGNLVEKRRDILRYARSLPPGPQRNQLLQTALSLRSLFKNKGWLDANTLEDSE